MLLVGELDCCGLYNYISIGIRIVFFMRCFILFFVIYFRGNYILDYREGEKVVIKEVVFNYLNIYFVCLVYEIYVIEERKFEFYFYLKLISFFVFGNVILFF